MSNTLTINDYSGFVNGFLNSISKVSEDCIINVDQAIKFKIEIYSDHRSQVMPGSAMIAAKKIGLFFTRNYA